MASILLRQGEGDRIYWTDGDGSQTVERTELTVTGPEGEPLDDALQELSLNSALNDAGICTLKDGLPGQKAMRYFEAISRARIAAAAGDVATMNEALDTAHREAEGFIPIQESVINDIIELGRSQSYEIEDGESPLPDPSDSVTEAVVYEEVASADPNFAQAFALAQAGDLDGVNAEMGEIARINPAYVSTPTWNKVFADAYSAVIRKAYLAGDADLVNTWGIESARSRFLKREEVQALAPDVVLSPDVRPPNDMVIKSEVLISSN